MIYNGRDFSDFGVHVDESKAFGSPEKDYELIEVVGRNGNLSIYNDRFKDIVLSFPCFIRSGFIEKYRNLLAYLNSLDGYQRLETEKEPNHFRKALFTGSVDVQTTPWNQGGFFTINFSALPQRFLKTGENWTTVSSSSSSVSGNPVTISNPSGLTALTGLSVDIQPVQDLNGYDAPWVGGAGKNLLNVSFGSGSYGSQGNKIVDDTKIRTTNAINVIPNTTYTVSFVVPRSANGLICYYTDSAFISRASLANTFTTPSTCTRITFAVTAESDGVNPKAMLELGSSASPYEPYENICPITGHTQALVTRYQDNLFDGETITEGYYNTGGVWVSNSNIVGAKNLIRVQGGERLYIASLDKAIQITAFSEYVKIGEDGSEAYISRHGRQNVVYNVPSNAKYLYFNFPSSYGSTYKNDLSINTDPTDTELHEPAQTVTVDLNGTRYGGTLDVLTGVLTVTHGYVDLGSLAWSVQTSGGKSYFRTSTQIADMKPSTSNTVVQPLQCSHYVADTWAHGTAVGYDSIIFEGWANRSYVGIADSRYTSVDDFETAMNGVQLLYELAEPTTVQLTAQQVSLLTGTNIISTDMANLTVTLSNPAELENPTLFESKPLIRVYGNGTLNVNNQYITVANSPYTYIDIDCELMDCYHGSNNANQYVSFSTTDYVTLRSGMNYFSYSGFTKVEVTPRWYEI